MGSIKQIIKYVVEILFNLPLLLYRKPPGSKIVLMLTPQYLNWGDHAIALSEKELIRERYPHTRLTEINLSFFRFWKQRLQKIISPDDFVIITGGGFVGDLWEDGQSAVEYILKTYRDNIIMLAPQTIFFQERERARYFRELIKNHGKVYALAREENTGEFLENILHLKMGATCNVVPDMAMLISCKPDDKRTRQKAALCFRSDQEKMISDSNINLIKQSLDKSGIPFVHMKMFYRHVEIPTWLRTAAVKWKLRQYAGKKVIITDRLHCMIFSAITATPCIAFDNISGKVSGVYKKWLGDLPYIEVIKDVRDFETALQHVTVECDHTGIMKSWQNKLKSENLTLIWKEVDKWNQKR